MNEVFSSNNLDIANNNARILHYENDMKNPIERVYQFEHTLYRFKVITEDTYLASVLANRLVNYWKLLNNTYQYKVFGVK